MTSARRMDGKICLVTGGGTGIGRAAALQMAREGAKAVVIAGRREQGGRGGGRRLPGPGFAGGLPDDRRDARSRGRGNGVPHARSFRPAGRGLRQCRLPGAPRTDRRPGRRHLCRRLRHQCARRLPLPAASDPRHAAGRRRRDCHQCLGQRHPQSQSGASPSTMPRRPP